MKSGRKKIPPNFLKEREPLIVCPKESFLSMVRRRSDARANVKLRPKARSVMSMVEADSYYEEDHGTRFLTQCIRFLIGCLICPLCWVTAWTLLLRFSHATVQQGLWHTPSFWYFMVGVIVMSGWFWSKIFQSAFLYCYILGHELTHAFFVKCFGGKLIEVKWSSKGGHVTTDKTNWVIALSPYFVPFWSIVAVIIYVLVDLFVEILPLGDQIFYGFMGATWTFHLAWTLWMIPRDQPDLKENGTFLSLTLIFLGNLLVLIILLCVASPMPLQSLKEFALTWSSTAIVGATTAWRWLLIIFEMVTTLV